MKHNILTLAEALSRIQTCRGNGKKIVFTNGCFDLLHPGHITYLEQARALGDMLIIGLNDDSSIHRLKGNHRPLNTLENRAAMLSALKSVDLVVAFSEDTPLNLIKAIAPDILVKGGDYEPDDIVGAREVYENGGKAIVMPFLEGHSSTSLIARIQALDT